MDSAVAGQNIVSTPDTEPIRAAVVSQAYNEVDKMLVEQVSKNKMTYTEIITVLSWLQQKVTVHMARDIMRTMAEEANAASGHSTAYQ